jgi:hypothetical protein
VDLAESRAASALLGLEGEEPEMGMAGGKVVTWAGIDGRIERMVDSVAAAEYAHPVARGVADIESVLTECAGTPLWSLSDKDIDELLPRAYTLVGRVMGSLVLPLVREADRRGLAAQFDAANTAGLVQDALLVPRAQARRMVELARAVEGDLTSTGEALAEGRISAEHAQVIAQSVADLPEQAAEWVPQAAEQELLAACEQYDPRVVAKLGRRIMTVVDPDRGDELLGRQLERADRAAEEGRQLHAVPCGRRVRLTGWFDTEGWQTVRTALDPLAAPRPAADDGGPDLRTHDRRLADALVELAERVLRTGDLPAQGGERPTLVLTLPYDKLVEQVGTGVLDTGEHLPTSTARRMACDAKIVPAVLGGAGQPLDVGRASRTVPGPLRRAVTVRDAGCTFPNCDIPPQWCDVHHAVHWSNGGPTALHNLLLACPAHHHTAHHTGWQVRIAPDGLPEWIPPAHIDPNQRPRRHHRHKPPPPPTPPPE